MSVSYGPSTFKKKFDPLTISGCFNCDDPKYTLRQCKIPMNVAKAASRRLEYYATKDRSTNSNTHLVLAEICHQLDIADDTVDEDGQDGAGVSEVRSDKSVFLSILDKMDGALSIHVTEVDEEDSDNREEPRIDSYQEDYKNSSLGSDIGTDPDVIEVFDTFASSRLALGETPAMFNGIYIDTGAQQSVVERHQARAYCRFAEKLFVIVPNATRVVFKFGAQRYEGLETMTTAYRLMLSTSLRL